MEAAPAPAVGRTAAVLVIVLFAVAVGVALRALADPRAERDDFLFNSDFLAPAALYQDVAVTGHGWRSFAVSPANFAAPDYAAYFAVRPLAGTVAASMLPWVGLLFALLVGGAWTAARQVLPPERRRFGLLVLGLWLAAYFGINALHRFHSQSRELLMPVSHAGALTVALAGFGLAVGGRWRMLAALSAVGFFSDRWLGFWLAAPLAVALIGSGKRAAVPLAAVAVGGLIGLVGLRWFTGPTDALDDFRTGIPWAGLPDRAAHLAAVLGKEIAAGNALVLAGLSWQLLALAVVVRRPANAVLLQYCLFSLTVTGLTTAVFLGSKLSVTHLPDHPWPIYSRYFLGPLGLGFFGWPTWLALTARRGAIVAVGAVVVVVAAAVMPRDGAVDLWDYAPAYVRAVDAAAEKHGVRDGLAGYAEAKAVTLLSKAGVRVVQVAADPRSPYQVSAFHWLMNARDFWQRSAGDAAPVRFQFVIAREGVVPIFGQSAEGFVRAFGEPAAREAVGPGLTLMVYNRPADAGLATFPELDAQTAGLRFRFDAADRVRFPGNSLAPVQPSHFGPTATADRPGVFAFGPGLPAVRPGRYRATFRVSAPPTAGPHGRVDVVFAGASVAHAVVEPGEREYAVDVAVTPAMLGGRVNFAAAAAGRGPVALHWVEFATIRE